MADQPPPPPRDSDGEEEEPPTIADAVSRVTVKALQDLELEGEAPSDSFLQPAPPGTIEENSEDERRQSRPSSATEGDTSTLLRNLGEGLGHVDSESDEEEEEDLEDARAASATYDRGAEDDEDAMAPDLVVLDPDHPLMKRFQAALNAQLRKQLEKTRLEHKELEKDLRSRKREREQVGVTLYGMQQDLARQQANLEQLHDKHTVCAQRRRDREQQLAKVRELYKNNQKQAEKEMKKNAELQTEVENLSTRLFYMQTAKDDIRSDIAVMKRAAEKADIEVSTAEMTKKRQDLHIDRLQGQLENLRENIAMYEAQQAAQAEETVAAKQSLAEAEDEIEGINVEKKQLFQQWNSSLIGMKRRDEAHAAMQEALSLAKQQVKSLETEIAGYKRSIQKEEEKNETLTMMMRKAEQDKSLTKKLIKQTLAKQDALKQQYGTYSRALHETEQSYNKATTERSMKLSEINALRKQIEREYGEKVQLEDEILRDLQTQLTADKAEHYTVTQTERIRTRKKNLEAEMSEVENEAARSSLQHTECQQRISSLQQQQETLEREIKSKNELTSRGEQEAFKRNALIERKQTQIDQFNKKIEQLLSSTGGVEVGPLEIQLNSLNKQIDSLSQEIADLQQFWLRQQHELVKLNQGRDQQNVDVDRLQKQHTILTQKKMRIENEITQQTSEQAGIDRSLRAMQNAMLRLNLLVTRESGIKEDLEQDNALTEKGFVAQLKDAELLSIQMQENLDNLRNEKEKLLNNLIEAERQIMLWEKKTQLAKETRSAVDSEVGQGEMRAMKAEIHRMQVRFTQLMKQQELMIREMEQVVSRRDTIVTRGEAQAKINQNVMTKGTFQKKLLELKRKIKQTQKDAGACDDDIRQLRENQAEIGRHLEEKQAAVQQLQGGVDELDGDVENLLESKQRNLHEIIARQTKVKHLQSLKDNKYTTLCKSADAVQAEFQKQEDRYMHTMNILDRVGQEFPHAQQALRRVAASYSLPE